MSSSQIIDEEEYEEHYEYDDDEVLDDEDAYEEIVDDDDIQPASFPAKQQPQQPYNDILAHPSDQQIRPSVVDEEQSAVNTFSDDKTGPSCLICKRTRTPKVRLFKWPKDDHLRQRWCEFFELDEKCVFYESAFICSFHFDANQFLYTGMDSSSMKIYWSSHAMPRYKLRRPAPIELFPWELQQKQPSVEIMRKMRRVLPSHPIRPHTVTFRNSRFKIRGRQKHAVAVISLPSKPHIQYEFSYNRTSKIDGTKFYSCLHCRRAKLLTRRRDSIRTIHLAGSTILSKGDPFVGHHYACQPIDLSIKRQENLMIDFSELPPVEYEEEIVPYVQPDGTQVTYIEDGAWNDTSYVIVDGEYLEEPPTLMADTLRAQQVRDRRQQDTQIHQTRKIHNHRKYSRLRVDSSPKCHICHRRFPSTSSLVQHLQWHLSVAPSCTFCQKTIDPCSSYSIRKSRICSKCMDGATA